MNQEEHDQAADERFKQRRAVREVKSEGSLEGIIDYDEIRQRQTRQDLMHPDDGLGLERILGTSDLLEINFLDIARRVARPVGRIQVRDLSGRIREFGTGFIVSPNLLLTNNHVLPSIDSARRSLVDLDFEDDESFKPKTPTIFGLEPYRFFLTDSRLDFTLVAVRPVSTDSQVDLAPYGFLRLIETKGKVLPDEYVAIIQHPGGATKKIALRNNKIFDLLDDHLHYTTDTDRGASGSPVFNDQWQVVALHHAGVKHRDEVGNILADDGTVWKPDMGEDRVAYIANEGVRISSILALLREVQANNTLPPEQRTLLDELFIEPAPIQTSGPIVPIDARERDMELFGRVRGYRTDFLDVAVELPVLTAKQAADAAQRLDGQGTVLEYVNFSVVMCRSRRMAYFTAVNIDGNKRKSIKRDRDVWYYDPRIARDDQAGPDLYDGNDLDRGHLVRREDPVWGRSAAIANEDTFHFTNCAPQHKHLNRLTWLSLEDYILKNAVVNDLKVSVFTGPVLRVDDMVYRGKFQIPAEYWKVVVLVKPGKKLSATAYLQTQKNLLEDLEFAYGAYRTYQVPVARIEAITGLDFGQLRQADPLADQESSQPARIISNPDDLRL